MQNTFFVSIDLEDAGATLSTIRQRIAQLGQAAPMQHGLWFLSTGYSMATVHDHLRVALEEADQLVVIDARGGFVSRALGSLVETPAPQPTVSRTADPLPLAA